jgi:hypothetical protein
MNTERQPVHTGGCQCGAVRYALYAEPSDPHICHCRMCQKAFGSFFAPLTGVALADFALTRGALSIFRSSELAERGFCSNCGTPLSFHYVDSPRIAVSIGSLDHPEKVPPRMQYGIEGRMRWFPDIDLPAATTQEDMASERYGAIHNSNRQHPDHDTAAWPPKETPR